MRLVEPPSRLTATEFRGVMDEGMSEPLLVVAYDEDWTEPQEIVLKLREPGVSAEYHGGTALACELLASMWARVLGFDVPGYAVVDVNETFVDSVNDSAIRKRIHSSIGDNFGTSYLAGCQTWSTQQRTVGQRMRQVLKNLLEFDSTILNADRTAEAPNLLWNGTSCFPIDHSLALAVCRKSPEAYESFLEEPLMHDEAVRAHVCFRLLRWKSTDFDAVAQKWKNLPVDEILDQMREHVPEQWETNPGDHDRVFDFLGRREHHVDMISDQLERLLA